MMRHNIYADYSEKFVKNVILYANKDNGNLFFDEQHTQEVYEKDLNNLFKKGLLVSFSDVIYAPISLSKNSGTDKTELKVYNGTTVYKFVSEAEEELEDVEVIPTAPTFSDSTGVITIPVKEGIIYKIGDDELESGEQDPIAKDTEVTVVAIAGEGYKIAFDSTTEWIFQWTE